jgi:hypothetical protein
MNNGEDSDTSEDSDIAALNCASQKMK